MWISWVGIKNPLNFINVIYVLDINALLNVRK